jgi:hypothetical protein
MNRVQQDFQDRIGEIEAYFSFIDRIDNGSALLIEKGSHEPAYTMQERNDLIRTFKASAFLLLYNLMESTVSNAIEAIFDELANTDTPFDSCCQNIRRVILGNLKQHNPEEIVSNFNCLATDVVTKTFQKNKIVSGNVDARKIKDVAKEYGFAHPSADGTYLLTVKTSRNDLAHGSKSFAEVGREYSMNEIIIIKVKVIAYLNAMLSNVADYIDQQHYLNAPQSMNSNF